jgi:enoyl-CoA hydratase
VRRGGGAVPGARHRSGERRRRHRDGTRVSAGADLRRYLTEGEPYARRFVPALNGTFRAVFELAKPVVTAVNGHAIAGGCVLAACGDVTLMADGRGRIGVSELAVGVPFPRVAMEVVRFAVGDVIARRLMLGAQTYPATDAQGLVDEDEGTIALWGRRAADGWTAAYLESVTGSCAWPR